MSLCSKCVHDRHNSVTVPCAEHTGRHTTEVTDFELVEARPLARAEPKPGDGLRGAAEEALQALTDIDWGDLPGALIAVNTAALCIERALRDMDERNTT